MKDITFETHIVAASPYSDKTNSFVKNTMQKIKLGALGDQLPSPKKRSLMEWLLHLHRPVLALLALAAITLVSGVVYAAVQFAPALVQLLGKETNQRGATEYSVAGLADCSNTYTHADRYEVVKDAPAISDDEVRKILQARCETQWLQEFPGKKWPTYGTHAQWKDGDTIFYTRLDMIGKVVHLTDTKAIVNLGDRDVEHTPPQGETIKAFASGVEVPLGDLKPGDTVFTISRVSEVYHKPTFRAPSQQESGINERPQEQPKVVGLVALFKLSLPSEYYYEKQAYLTEIPECQGNPGERCPTTPSIDIYPRGEGGGNPYLQKLPEGDFREISGTVTKLGDDTLTLQSSKGKLYTVTVGDNGFGVYNRDFTGAYTGIDATLKVGSTVKITYNQPKGADPTVITKEQVYRVDLQAEGVAPKKNLQPY